MKEGNKYKCSDHQYRCNIYYMDSEKYMLKKNDVDDKYT